MPCSRLRRNPKKVSIMNNVSAMPVQAGFVFIGIFVGLVFAGLLGKYLRTRRPDTPQPLLDSLISRLSVWWVMTIVLLLAFWFGNIGAVLLFLMISFTSLREFMTRVYRNRSAHNAVAACFYILLPLQYYFVLTDWYSMFTVLVPVYAFLILPVIVCLSGENSGFFERTAKIQWGAMITVFCLSHVPALINLPIAGFEDKNILLILFMIAVVQGSDVFQYLFGKLLGTRPIMPHILPDKTLAGTLGGIAAATAFAAALFWLTPFTPVQAAAIGLMLAVCGFFGDVVMSIIKQNFGIKDWGRMIRGHGGMLDRVDSICFAAPIFFHIVRYYWA